MIEDDRDKEARLNQILDRLFSLNDELARVGPEEDGHEFLEKWRAVHKLKEEYRRLTGVYPNLPPSEQDATQEPRPS